jgi:Ca-activated chloride channel family protein
MFVALALLLLALARPTAAVTLPWAKFDDPAGDRHLAQHARGDVQPTRMVAAQDAAKAFLSQVPRHIEVGLVTFAGTAQVAQGHARPPRGRRRRRRHPDAVRHRHRQRHRGVPGRTVPRPWASTWAMTFGTRARAAAAWTTRRGDRSRRPAEITPVAPGSYESAAIILLSDGRRTTGVDTLQAAKLAADRGVRIYVVGLGTPDGHAAMTTPAWRCTCSWTSPRCAWWRR